MDNDRHQRLLEWICTGRHVFGADYVKPAAGSSSSVPINDDGDKLPDASPPSPTRSSSSASSASSASSSSSPVSDRLIGVDDGDDNPLIPTSAAIERVFRDGRATWTAFLKRANSLPAHAFPAGLGDPSVMLKDVPALPAHLPRHGHIAGRPLWHVPDPEHEGDGAVQGLDLQYLHGRRVYFSVSSLRPVECHVYSHPPLPGHELLSAQRGLSILTMCWSYILSVRLLELQRRKPVYSQHCLLPVTAKAFKPSAGEMLLDLGASASPKLLKWLCAIISPRPGWTADGGGFPPWAAFCTGQVRFVVAAADGPAGSPFPGESSPNSAEATELLIEFCAIYGLLEPEHQPDDHQPGHQPDDHPPELSPVTTAFFAALMLPFYRFGGLRPQFPNPILKRCSAGMVKGATREPTRIRQYAADLRYYMTLSMNTKCLGSALWSMFWQPDIETNLVSPWLSSISRVLKPVLESRNLGQLAKVFACRRPRIASWWLGIFLLGDFTILDRIACYLETLEERWDFGSMSLPDSTVAAWTGSPQSFLDDESSSPYTHPNEPISRSDVLRHRYNFRLQDDSCRALSWRPFGHVARELVEPDLWPWLERGHVREYVHWVWWVKTSKGLVQDVQLGFRKDTGRFVPGVPDHLGTLRGRGRISANEAIRLGPSRDATLRMLNFCMQDVRGGRDTCLLGVSVTKSHPWLKYWAGVG